MTKSTELVNYSPAQFIQFLKSKKIRKFYFVWDRGHQKVRASHSELQPIADYLQNDSQHDYSRHEGMFFQISKKHDVLQGAFVHKTRRGQAAGGTRLWRYETIEQFLRDGMRLSKGMTHKNALAGLWWGGGKGVMAENPDVNLKDPKVRASIFQEYGDLVTSLNGSYITAEDVGTDTTDVGNIFSHCRFTISVPEEFGGSGNPSIATAKGVVRGIEGALGVVNGGPQLNGRTVVVQGMGHVGGPLIRFLFEKNVGKIIACDISQEVIDQVVKENPGQNLEARLAERGDNSILSEPCDVLVPCATGAILNPDTIPTLQTKIVCGAANNQLQDPDLDDKALFERGIYYVPDFLVNRMGIVNCANEQYGYLKPDPLIERHLGSEWDHSVYKMTQKVLRLAKETGETPGRMAVRLAEEHAEEKHPLFGHRGQMIINSLVAQSWHNN